MSDNQGWGWGWVSAAVNNVVSTASNLGQTLLAEPEPEPEQPEQGSPSETGKAVEETSDQAKVEDQPTTPNSEANTDGSEQVEEAAAASSGSMLGAFKHFLEDSKAFVQKAEELNFVKHLAVDIATSTKSATQKIYAESSVIIEKSVDVFEYVGKAAASALDVEAWNRPITVSSKLGPSGVKFEELFREYNGLHNLQILKVFATECANKTEALIASAAGNVSAEHFQELKNVMEGLTRILAQDQFILENAKAEQYSKLLMTESGQKIATLSAESHAKAAKLLADYTEISDKPASSSELLNTSSVMIEKAKIEALLVYAKLASIAIEEMLQVARFLATKAESADEDNEDEQSASDESSGKDAAAEKADSLLRLLPNSWRQRVAVSAQSAPSEKDNAAPEEGSTEPESSTPEDQAEETSAIVEPTTDDTYADVANQLRLYVFFVMRELSSLCNAYSNSIQQIVAATKSKHVFDAEVDEDTVKTFNQELNRRGQSASSDLSQLSNTTFTHILDALSNTHSVLRYVTVSIG